MKIIYEKGIDMQELDINNKFKLIFSSLNAILYYDRFNN